MKLFTSEFQTARLMQLGFPNPKGVSKLTMDIDMDTVPTFNYSVGELIEMVPQKIYDEESDFAATFQMTAGWEIYYTTYSDIFYYHKSIELIDALFDMTVELKEKKVI